MATFLERYEKLLVKGVSVTDLESGKKMVAHIVERNLGGKKDFLLCNGSRISFFNYEYMGMENNAHIFEDRHTGKQYSIEVKKSKLDVLGALNSIGNSTIKRIGELSNEMTEVETLYAKEGATAIPA